MHFEIKNADIQFIGYSIFQTNAKGAYEKSLLASQNFLEKEIAKYVDISLLEKVKFFLTLFLKQTYFPVYEGCIGVDMLIYENGGKYCLQPCVEINMRKSMGYLAIMLHKKYICENSTGYFSINYSKNTGDLLAEHRNKQKKYPLIFDGKRIKSGYTALCPISAESNYSAFVEIS